MRQEYPIGDTISCLQDLIIRATNGSAPIPNCGFLYRFYNKNPCTCLIFLRVVHDLAQAECYSEWSAGDLNVDDLNKACKSIEGRGAGGSAKSTWHVDVLHVYCKGCVHGPTAFRCMVRGGVEPEPCAAVHPWTTIPL